MSEEFRVILGCFLVNWVTLLLLLRYSDHKKRIALIHLSIQSAYSILFLYNYLSSGPGGGILAVYFLWFIVQGVHLLSYLIHLLIILIKRMRQKSH